MADTSGPASLPVLPDGALLPGGSALDICIDGIGLVEALASAELVGVPVAEPWGPLAVAPGLVACAEPLTAAWVEVDSAGGSAEAEPVGALGVISGPGAGGVAQELTYNDPAIHVAALALESNPFKPTVAKGARLNEGPRPR